MRDRPAIRSLDTTQVTNSATGDLVRVREGWPVLISGNHPDLYWSFERQSGSFQKIAPGQVIPPPPEGMLYLRTSIPALVLPQSVRAVVEAWHPEDMPSRAAGGQAIAEAGRRGSETAWLSAKSYGPGDTNGQRYLGRHSGTVTMSGTSSAAAHFTVQYSVDGLTYRDGLEFDVGAGEEFSVDLVTSAPYVALKSDDTTDVDAELSW